MGLSISNTLTLRQYYHNNRTLVTKANRSEAGIGKLSFADASALRNAISKLGDYKFKDATDDDKVEKLKAFCDTYNYTLSSSAKYAKNDTAVRNNVKRIKELTSQHESELSNCGFSIDKTTGQLSISDSAAKNIGPEKFEKLLGSDSKYMKDLYSYAKKLTKHIDITL